MQAGGNRIRGRRVTSSMRLLLLPAVLLVLLLSGCSSDGTGDSGTGDSGGGDSATTSLEEPADRGSLDGAADQAGDEAAAEDGGSRDSGSQGSGPAGNRQAVDPAEAVISTAVVSLESGDVTRARQKVRELTDRFEGQVADEESESGDEGIVHSRLVLRIPTADFSAAIEALEQVGKLDASTRTTEVVTDQVRDVAARVRAQEQSLRRLEALMARAKNLDEIIRLEAELGRRQADLDALKARQATLADRTAMSTITVHLSRTEEGPVEDEADEDEARGFLAGLSAGWSGLAATATLVATVVGALLPWVPVLALVVVPLWWLLRVRGATGAPSGPSAQRG